MTHSKKLLSAVSATALLAFGATPALAVGTSAGDSIINNVTVDFRVGGFAQTAETASDELTVDRKINVTVAEVGGGSTEVSPGETLAWTEFTVDNLSNDVADFALTVAQPGGDDFDLTNVTIYLDDGDGVFDSGDTVVTYLDELGADEQVTVFVVGNVPTGLATGDEALVVLTADAHAGDTAGSLGSELTTTTGANSALGVDTVLADAQGLTDSQYDGAFSAQDAYEVLAAALSAAKVSRIISDPVHGISSEAKAIPGAVIEYCIAVTNSGGATATDIVITDTLPGTVTWDSSFGIYVDGSIDNAGVCSGGNDLGSHNNGVVSGSLSDIAAGVTSTLYFRATIN